MIGKVRICAWLALLALALSLAACGLAEQTALIPENTLTAGLLDAPPDFSGWEDGEPFIRYGAPDSLGRATAACAILGPDSLTQRERPDMSDIQPTGLHNAKYEFIRDGWVYNRCHLIGHQFSGESIRENLIAGTHALNHSYMLPWENEIAAFIRKTGRRVFYRVTPEYEGDDLVCASVLLEAMCADGGQELCFSVRCPNAQPGVCIDYGTGYTTRADDWIAGGTTAGDRLHVINTRTGKFHLPDCRDAKRVGRRNRAERLCNRAELIAEGLIPCGKCLP